MKRRFSDDDLLRFLYNELPPAESDRMMDALVKDEELWQRYESFQQVAEQMPEVALQPSEASLEAVMAHVRSSSLLVEEEAPLQAAWQRVRMVSGKSIVVGLNSLVLLGVGIFFFIAVGSSALPWRQAIEIPQESVQASAAPVQEADLSWDTGHLEEEVVKLKRGMEQIRLKPVL